MRFALLLHEMESIQQGIRALDTARFQIKGWAITLAAAAGGVAATSDHGTFATIGLAITLSFLVVDSYYKSIQRIRY